MKLYHPVTDGNLCQNKGKHESLVMDLEAGQNVRTEVESMIKSNLVSREGDYFIKDHCKKCGEMARVTYEPVQ